ncbi:MAG TPA: SAM-dependent methyltransferase [Hanamia sp.]|nr:SAM-dependent methyltransferase [Hanamia sp.]
MELTEIIIQRIKNEGPLSFRDFMEMALYYPALGYYTSEKEKFGKKGDYYTSPGLSSLYGKMLGKQLEEMWRNMEEGTFTIVEYGAGTGELAFDILNYLENNPAFFQKIKYFIIEKSTPLKYQQQQLLKNKVTWIHDIKELNGFTGCVLSNEVLDNFSVNAVVMKDELMEVFVAYEDGFTEVLHPASEELKNYLAEQRIVLTKDYRTEINLGAIEWIQSIADNLKQGYVITIDYGYLSNEYYADKRNLGTLACYYQHTVTDQLYANIGRQDITAHVNFSSLHVWGRKYGLDYSGFCNQNYFLRSLGLSNYLRQMEMENLYSRESLFQVNKLLMDMGNKFKVLIQQKGIPNKALTGMQFAQPVI